MRNPSPKSVARRYASSGRVKTAGEVRFIKDRGSDKSEWGWNTPGPSQREIGDDFVFNAKYLKPLAKVLRSCLMALGHATSAHARLVKVKSRNVSPDGALGGRGYIQKIPDMRRQLMNCVEVLSAITDTVYDEINAPHWNPSEDTLTPRDREEVREIVEDAEEIKDDPEAWAEEQEDEMSEDQDGPVSKTARLQTPMRVKLHNLDTGISNLDSQVGRIRSLATALRSQVHQYDEEGDLLDPEFSAVIEKEVGDLARIAWDLHKDAVRAAKAAESATIARPRMSLVASRYARNKENSHG